MKKISTIAVSFVFALLFTAAAFGQAPQPAKIGWIDTAQFADEKEGVTKYNNALKALDTEMKPRVTELTALQTRLQKIAEEIRTATNVPAGVPVNQQVVGQKQDEGQKLQREFEFKKKEYDAAVEKRSSEVLGPVSADISRAIQDYAKQKGYAVVLDIAALANANAILALDGSANITKDFITFYNARPATTASTVAPK